MTREIVRCGEVGVYKDGRMRGGGVAVLSREGGVLGEAFDVVAEAAFESGKEEHGSDW